MANKKKLRITDEVNLKPIEIVPTTGTSINDNIGGPNPTSVTIRVAATHAGIVTRNNTFYLPDRMRAGVPTWTEQYNKPVLVHHQKDHDPIGRVVHADYVDLSGAIGPVMQNNLFRDSIVARDKFSRFIKGNMSFGLQVDYVKDNFSRADIADDKNYEGLGYIMLTATITDPDAIQKIKDGRYLTGSVSASTDRAVCSVCKQDWLDEGQCDHEPGSVYDGTRAFIIAGNFEYEEWSYVNKPADRHSKTLEIVNSLSNNKEKVQTMEAKTQEVKDNLEVATPETQVVAAVVDPPIAEETPVVIEATTKVESEQLTTETPATITEPIVDKAPEECKVCKERAGTGEAELKKLADQLNAVREEYKYLILDVASLEDQLVKARMDARAARATRVADYARLEGAKSSVKDLVDSMLSELDDKTLNSKFESVDMKNIIDKLDSGLSREPSGSVEPTAAIITDKSKQPGNNQANAAESKITPNAELEEKKMILDTLEHMRVRSGAAAAERYKARLIRDGYVWLSEVI